MPADAGRILLAKYLVSSRHYRAATPPEPADPICRWRQFGAVRLCHGRRSLALALYLERAGSASGRHWTARVANGRVVLTRHDRPHRCPPSMRVRDPRQEREGGPDR